MWSKNGDLARGTKKWQEALDYANGLTYCGHTDWRLPNRKEIYSIVNAEELNMSAWLNSQGFNNALDGYYWSSSTYIYSFDDAWAVSPGQGDISPKIKNSTGSIWPVRGGQSAKLPPAVPDTLKAVATTPSKVILTWNDKSAYEGSIKVFRRNGTGAFTLLKSLPPDTLTYSDLAASDKSTSITYAYYVKACNLAGCSTGIPFAIVPYSPDGLAVTKVAGGVRLTWNDNSSNEKGFKIYRKNGSCASTDPLKLVKTINPNITAFTGAGLVPGQYSYRIRSFTQNGAAPFSQGFSVFSGCMTVTVP